MHDLNYPDTSWSNLIFNNVGISALHVHPLYSMLPVLLNRVYFALVPDTLNKPLIYFNDFPIGSSINPIDNGLDKNEVKQVTNFITLAPYDFAPVQITFCSAQNPFIYRWQDSLWVKSYSGSELTRINTLYSDGYYSWGGGAITGKTSSLLFLKHAPYDSAWMEIYPSIGTGKICYSIVSSYSNPQLLFAGLNGAVIKSTDGGLNWDYTSLKNDNYLFTSLVVNPLSPNQIFAGGKDNNNLYVLFKSDNNGIDWEPLAMNSNYRCSIICILNGINTMAGAVINNKFIMYIGTDGSGIFKYSDNVVSVEDIKIKSPDNFYLLQNYPNPFNPTTIIKYNIPEESFVTLKIYDIMGKELRTIESGYKRQGVYNIEFNAAGLSSGIYFYRLNAGKFVSTKKMILLK